MVTSGQPHDGGLGAVPRGERAGISTGTLRELADVTLASGAYRPRLLDRHLILLITGGYGAPEVDFVAHPCRPGVLIRLRPGQVISYGHRGGLDAVLLTWTGEVVEPDPTGAVSGPTRWRLTGEDEDAVINEITQLHVDCRRQRAGGLDSGLLRQQLATLLLRLALLPADAPAAEPDVLSRFRDAVEHSYAECRRIEEYADQLGCSVRTLTRACLAATGAGAKRLLDERVALQAKRLLAATDLPVAEVGHRLGFPEPTNFGRFFQRQVGCPPGAFRARFTAEPRPLPAGPTPVPNHRPGACVRGYGER